MSWLGSSNISRGMAVLLVVLVGAVGSQGKIIYVDANAPGTNDGTSWENAYNFLQDALADAESSGDVNEIRVAQGIYRPDETSTDPNGSGDREATFQLTNGVALMGGYAGFGEADPNEKDVELYETVLSGDLDGDDVGFTNNGENSYHVVDTEMATLDSLTIMGGHANGSGAWEEDGGGVYSRYTRDLTLLNCTLSYNCTTGWGGGIYQVGTGSSRIDNCRFENNVASVNGGGIYNGCNSHISTCIFASNSAGVGGAIGNEFGNATIADCRFNRNSGGGGSGIAGSHSNCDIEECYFNDNSGSSGTVFVYHSDFEVNGCHFVGNSMQLGGAVFIRSSNIRINNCTLVNNTAVYEGGGVCIDTVNQFESNVNIANTIFWLNSAPIGSQIAIRPSTIGLVEISYCNIQGYRGEIYDPINLLDWLEGNIETIT